MEIAFYYWLVAGITNKKSYETHLKLDRLKFVLTTLVGALGIYSLINI